MKCSLRDIRTLEQKFHILKSFLSESSLLIEILFILLKVIYFITLIVIYFITLIVIYVITRIVIFFITQIVIYFISSIYLEASMLSLVFDVTYAGHRFHFASRSRTINFSVRIRYTKMIFGL